MADNPGEPFRQYTEWLHQAGVIDEGQKGRILLAIRTEEEIERESWNAMAAAPPTYRPFPWIRRKNR